MKIQLNASEARVIGCLLEKEIATPDQYPLSLNALVNACNQKSNRDPVLDLTESAVQQAVDSLLKKFLVSRASGYSGRVTKYQHRFCNTDFGELKLSARAVGIVCELLRGPQTPGELRARANRLCNFADVSEVEAELESLMAREAPIVAKLPREPGRRESRYRHLFGEGFAAAGALEDSAPIVATARANRERIDALEEDVRVLREAVDELRRNYDALAR